MWPIRILNVCKLVLLFVYFLVLVRKWLKYFVACGGGLVVSVLALTADDPGSNPVIKH